jgi:NADPH2:quinone reductase
MGIDEIKSQSQGGRLAPTDGGCIQRGEVGASIGAADRFKTINVIRRREQETIIRNLGGNEVICTEDKALTARLQELTAGNGVERAIDCVAGELGAEIARNLAPAGTMLMYGALSSHRQTDPPKFTMPLFAPRLIYSTATVRGWWLPRWVSSQPLAEVRDERSSHHVIERSTYAAIDCALFI